MIARISIVAVMLLALLTPVFADTPAYTVWDLGATNGKANSGLGQGNLNEFGMAAGFSYNDFFADSDAWVWNNDALIQLPSLPGGYAASFCLNNKGEACGFSGADFFNGHAALWDSGGVHDLLPLPGDLLSFPQGMNNLGQVVGASAPDGNVFSARAMVWTNHNSRMLSGLPGAATTVALDINDKGLITGLSGDDFFIRAPVYWTRSGGPVQLPTIGGGLGEAVTCNNRGTIAGYTANEDLAFHPTVWMGGTMLDLGTFGGTFGKGLMLDGKDRLVGFATDADEVPHAFLWTGGSLIDLNTLIAAESGWYLLDACGINEQGWITGNGLYNGVPRAYILKPYTGGVN